MSGVEYVYAHATTSSKNLRFNENLFLSAVSLFQSGSLFEMWGWYLSEKVSSERIEKLKTNINCELDDIYECYKGKTGLEVLQSSPIGLDFFYHPVPDNDFFSSNITEEVYDLARRSVSVDTSIWGCG